MPNKKTTAGKHSKKASAANGKKESLKAIYARHRREFSAADLQKYTEEMGQTFPIRPLLDELEAIHRKESRKR